MRARPNIIIFMPDQQRADAVGAFGNPVVRTPNLDALAARGVRFDDPALGIDWPAAEDRIISERDLTWPDLETAGAASSQKRGRPPSV